MCIPVKLTWLSQLNLSLAQLSPSLFWYFYDTFYQVVLKEIIMKGKIIIQTSKFAKIGRINIYKLKTLIFLYLFNIWILTNHLPSYYLAPRNWFLYSKVSFDPNIIMIWRTPRMCPSRGARLSTRRYPRESTLVTKN